MIDAAEFNRRMRALPEPPSDSAPPYWDHWRYDLWQRGQAEDPNSFMGWPCVYHTMLVSHWSMDWQLSQLQADDWARWEPTIQYPDVGTPPDYQPGTNYSKNLINQAYHVLQWEQRTGRRIDRVESIVEFGGGYGALALVCQRLGFVGRYTIVDLPEFSLLQQWFLGQVDVEAEYHTDYKERETYDLLIAIYSLSEVSHYYRNLVLDRLSAASYLFIYSQTWQEWDNLAWFTDWTGRMPGYEWRHWPMVLENDRPDWYCVGWK